MEDVTRALYPSADHDGIAHVALDQLHPEAVEICLCRLSAGERAHAEPDGEKRSYDRGSDEARGSRHEGKIFVRHWHHQLKPPLTR